jgi:hypothetical protein
MTAAKSKFDEHLAQCSEAIAIHEFLDGHGYSADFGLRFVWVASVSALDHYVTELIVEKSTEHFSNGGQLSAKLLSEVVSTVLGLAILLSAIVGTAEVVTALLLGRVIGAAPAVAPRAFRAGNGRVSGALQDGPIPPQQTGIVSRLNEPFPEYIARLGGQTDFRGSFPGHRDRSGGKPFPPTSWASQLVSRAGPRAIWAPPSPDRQNGKEPRAGTQVRTPAIRIF